MAGATDGGVRVTLRAVSIDFAGVSRRWSGRAAGLLLVAGAVLAWAALECLDAWQTLGIYRQDHARQLRRTAPQPAPAEQGGKATGGFTPPARAAAAQIQAVNRHIRQLNIPWDAVFSSVRPPGGIAVDLLALETAARAGALRVSALAPRAEVMTEYLAYLAEKRKGVGQARLHEVYLVRHETPHDGGMRFDLEAVWQPRR